MLSLKKQIPGKYRELYLSIRFFFKKKGAAILMYHSVGDNNVFFTVRPNEFRRQMDYLKNNQYRVISLAELVDALKSDKPLSKKTAVLTFDDGYKDNHYNVFPVLKEYNFPATIFLASGLVGKEISNSQGISLPILSWKEIEEMDKSGLIDFEPHTANHIRLDQVDVDQARREIIDSKKIIEQKLNKECRFFAYPGGRHNQEIVRILKNSGFESARGVTNGYIFKGDDLFFLKKVPVRLNTSLFLFKLKI